MGLNVSDKPIKHIELSTVEWKKVKEQLIEDFGQKILISWVMKRECGFTVRTHTRWQDDQSSVVVCLDFYDEQMKTWYILKYT